jgi:hypothetical protein
VPSSRIVNLGYDTTFSLNEFSQPRLRSEIELVKNVVLYVLFSKPGQYPSLPNIGLDIQSMLFSFYDEIDVNDLIRNITSQCNALGAYFNDGTIQIKKTKYKNQPSLMIYIEGTESYPLDTGYLISGSNDIQSYMIGITFDELNQMIYNISETKGV